MTVIEQTIAPTIAVTAPTGTVTISKPTVTWTYTPGDSGAQTQYQVKAFTSAQYSIGGFDPNTSPSTYDSGAQLGAGTSAVAGPLSSATYRAYVRAAQSVGGAPQWSAWAFSGFTVALPAAAPVLSPDQVYITRPTVAHVPPVPAGRSYLRVYSLKTDLASSIIITCGDGIIYETANVSREMIPLNNGIPVRSGVTYGFNISVSMQNPAMGKALLLWFGKTGKPDDLVSVTGGAPFQPSDTNWVAYQVSDSAPTNASYLAPCLFFSARTDGTDPTYSPYIDIAAAMVYSLGEGAGAAVLTAPDRYLTMGDPSETIGAPKTGFTGFVLGEPPR